MATRAELEYIVRVSDRDLRELQQRLKLVHREFGNVPRATAGANAGFVRLNQSAMRSSGVMRSFRSQLALTAGAFIGGAGLVGAFRSTITIAAEFEQSMNVLQAASRGTATQMKAASAEARRLGRDASLPATSAADAANAMTQLAKGGLDVTQSMKAARGTLQLAAAAGIEEAEAATITARALTAFSLEGREAGKVSDLLAAAANAATGEIPDMAYALQQSSAIANQAGVSIEDTVTAITRLAKAGIIGSDAGTSFRVMLQRMVPQTGKAAEKMDELGIRWKDAEGNLVPLRDQIGQYQRALDRLTPAQRAVALQTIFGTDAQRAAAIILRGGTKEWDAMRVAVTKQGAAAELSRARNKGFSGTMDALRSNIETLQIGIGTALIPTLNTYLKRASEWLTDRNPARYTSPDG